MEENNSIEIPRASPEFSQLLHEGEEWLLQTTVDRQLGKNWPRISIVTPSFNQANYLEKTIRSVLLQGYAGLEFIIIDGGSTDDSVSIIKKYESWIDYWVSEQDRGQSHAINKGFAKANGDMLGWLNSDDYFARDALVSIAETWTEREPNTGAVVGDGEIIGTSGATWYRPPMLEIDKESIFRWLEDGNFMQPSCFFSFEAWEKCGPLDENIHIALDVDLWLSISERYEFQRINRMLSYSLKHEDAKTTRFEHRMCVDLAFVFLKHDGVDAARYILDLLAERLFEYETELRYLRNRPANRLDRKMRSLLLKLFGRSGDVDG